MVVLKSVCAHIVLTIRGSRNERGVVKRMITRILPVFEMEESDACRGQCMLRRIIRGLDDAGQVLVFSTTMFGNTLFLKNGPRSLFVIHRCARIVNKVEWVKTTSRNEQTLSGIAQKVTEIALRTKASDACSCCLQTTICCLIGIQSVKTLRHPKCAVRSTANGVGGRG